MILARGYSIYGCQLRTSSPLSWTVVLWCYSYLINFYRILIHNNCRKKFCGRGQGHEFCLRVSFKLLRDKETILKNINLKSLANVSSPRHISLDVEEESRCWHLAHFRWLKMRQISSVLVQVNTHASQPSYPPAFCDWGSWEDTAT